MGIRRWPAPAFAYAPSPQAAASQPRRLLLLSLPKHCRRRLLGGAGLLFAAFVGRLARLRIDKMH
jgi:hypothetical protein